VDTPRGLVSRWLSPLVLTSVLACAAASVSAPAPAHAQAAVSLSFFYDQLAPYGQWVQNPEYGWVWYPTAVPAGWQPYSDGRWVWTDDGWYFDSDWSWGWATFHYGRWYYDASYGWAWVPGTVWSPAWVAWRSGGGYVGWAPLPPRVGWRAGVGFSFGGEISLAIGQPYWAFVQDRAFCSPHVRDVIIARERNRDLYGRTRDRTRYEAAGQRAINRSMPVEHYERAAHTWAPRARFVDAASPHAPHASEHGRLAVFRPEVQAAAANTRPPRSAAAAPLAARSRVAITPTRAPQSAAWPHSMRAVHLPAVRDVSAPRHASVTRVPLHSHSMFVAPRASAPRHSWSRSTFMPRTSASRISRQSAWSHSMHAPHASSRVSSRAFSSRAAQSRVTFRSAPRFSSFSRAATHSSHTTRARRR
jgi:hypothetical protein